MPETSDRTCERCKFCILQDYGYSNYTVEGTSVICAKQLHPDSPFDRFYGEEPRLKFAEKCDGFEAGAAIDMDVEEDGVASLSEEQLRIYKMK